MNTGWQGCRNCLLKRQNGFLCDRIDELGQYSCRPSIRVYGVPEQTPGTTDTKLLKLCKNHLKLEPTLELSDIKVSHRVGKPIPPKADCPANQEQTPPPRAFIARVASRRTEARIVSVRKRLRPLGRQHTWEEPSDDTEAKCESSEPNQDFPYSVYISDGLTQKKLSLCRNADRLNARRKHQILGLVASFGNRFAPACTWNQKWRKRHWTHLVNIIGLVFITFGYISYI